MQAVRAFVFLQVLTVRGTFHFGIKKQKAAAAIFKKFALATDFHT